MRKYRLMKVLCSDYDFRIPNSHLRLCMRWPRPGAPAAVDHFSNSKLPNPTTEAFPRACPFACPPARPTVRPFVRSSVRQSVNQPVSQLTHSRGFLRSGTTTTVGGEGSSHSFPLLFALICESFADARQPGAPRHDGANSGTDSVQDVQEDQNKILLSRTP